jgi:hypothetical protein
LRVAGLEAALRKRRFSSGREFVLRDLPGNQALIDVAIEVKISALAQPQGGVHRYAPLD